MQYIKTTDNGAVPHTLRQFRKDNPQVSFPEVPSLTSLAESGVYPATYEQRPEIAETQVAERNSQPTDQGDGTYVWGWTVKDKPVAQLAEEARDKRNTLLTSSDYTQLSDSPRDKQAWATYRQALRDITDQEGFPETIVWPVKP